MKYAYVTEKKKELTKGLEVEQVFTDAEAMFAVLKKGDGDTVVLPTLDGLFPTSVKLYNFLQRLLAMDVIISFPEAGFDTSTFSGKAELMFFMADLRNTIERSKVLADALKSLHQDKK